MSKDEVEIEIGSNGIIIQHQLFGERKIDWEDAKKMTIRTSLRNIEYGNSKTSLPIEIDSAKSTIGLALGSKEQEDEQRSLSDMHESKESAEEFLIWERLEQETGIVYDRNEDQIHFSNNKSATKVFADFVEFMFDNGYMDYDDLPWATKDATKNYVLNTEPKDMKGEVSPSYQEIYNGVYFYSKLPVKHKKNYVKLIVEDLVKND